MLYPNRGRVDTVRDFIRIGNKAEAARRLDELIGEQAELSNAIAELQADLECPEALSDKMAKLEDAYGTMTPDAFQAAASELEGRKVDKYEGRLIVDSLGGHLFQFEMSAGSTPEQVKLELRRLALEWCAENMEVDIVACNGVR